MTLCLLDLHRNGTTKCKKRKLKKPSAYNSFMRRELKRVLAAHPELTNRDVKHFDSSKGNDFVQAFKIAARNWTRSPSTCTTLDGDKDFHSIQEASQTSEIQDLQTERNEVSGSRLESAHPSSTHEHPYSKYDCVIMDYAL